MPFCIQMLLFLVAACFDTVDGFEIHEGHAAVHQTALWRRSSLGRHRPEKSLGKGSMAVEIKANAQTMINTSTEIKDQRTEYIGSIGVGTSKSGNALFHANVVFDTGSTNLWVASVLCNDYPCDTDRAKEFYDPEKSLTQESYRGETQGDIDILFGTGELKGPLHIDTYRVGPMEVKRQPFAMIRKMEGDVFSSFPFEGILGLGFKSLSFAGIDPFFDRVIEQKLLTNNEFAFYMNVDSDRPSAILWGGIDKDLYNGPIRMFPVVQPHYWALNLLDFKIGNKSMKHVSSMAGSVRRLIVDSGTTYFTAPTELHERIVDKLQGATCDSVSDYPPLTYVLGGSDGQTYELVVSQETYMVGRDDGDCHAAFMALDVNARYGPAMILGEVFMRHFFTVFSRGDGRPHRARIGFAAANVGATPKVEHAKPEFHLPATSEDDESFAQNVRGHHHVGQSRESSQARAGIVRRHDMHVQL